MNFSQAFEATTLDSFVTGQVRKKMDAMADVLKAELDAAQGHIRVLNVLYHKGDIGITTDEFEENLENLETKIVLCQVNLAVLQRHKNQFIGEYIDDMGTQFDGRRIDDAVYIDRLISRYRTPDNAKLTIFKSRDAAAQERFRNDVFSEYDANVGEHKWCCISGYTEDSCDVVAAHIVPYNMGEVNAEYLFGKSGPSMKNGHIMSSHNGIPMIKMYDRMFDDGRMTLVPVPGTTKIRVVVFSALDPNPLVPRSSSMARNCLSGTIFAPPIAIFTTITQSPYYDDKDMQPLGGGEPLASMGVTPLGRARASIYGNLAC